MRVDILDEPGFRRLPVIHDGERKFVCAELQMQQPVAAASLCHHLYSPLWFSGILLCE